MSEHPNAAVIRSAYEAISKGDMPAVAGLLDDDITWYESTGGMEGIYHGRDRVLAFLGQVFQQAGMQMSVSIHDILANDDHAVILHESTLTVGDRTHTGQYADVYHLRDGKITAHSRAAERPGPGAPQAPVKTCLFRTPELMVATPAVAAPNGGYARGCCTWLTTTPSSPLSEDRG